jgi:hydroxysqualene dehydroxylase
VTAVERAPDGWTLRVSAGTTSTDAAEPTPRSDDDGSIDRTNAPRHFDRVILATPATEAARLVRPLAPGWADVAGALAHEPIVTLVLHAPPRAWPAAMLALDSDATRRPAQFAFRLAPQDAAFDRVTLVVSAAGEWLARGQDVVVAAATLQYRTAFGIGADEAVTCASVRADRRATFRCSAGVVRPAMTIAPSLLAAADFVAGPYPATLEAAVMAGEAAAAALG